MQPDQQRGAHGAAQEQAEHARELDVADAHALRVGERRQQEEAAAGGARDQALDLAGWVEQQAEDDRGDRRGGGELVRQQARVEVDQRQRDEERDEHEPEHELRGVVVVDGDDEHEQQRGPGLDERVAARDRLAAVAAAPSQQQPRDDGDVVARAHRRVALRAVRARVLEHRAARQPVGDDVEERADDEAAQQGDERPKSMATWRRLDERAVSARGTCSEKVCTRHWTSTGSRNFGGERYLSWSS